MNYQSAIQYLYNQLPVFHHVGGAAYKPGLENTIKLMNEFDNPQKKFKSIHVAGTNGKGSVSHFLAAILQSAGYKTGLYTSPHLVDFGERIRIDGKKISQNFVIDFVKRHKELFKNIQPSFFEVTMAMAFCYFAEEDVDVAVIEVGMGGRLDSTNIIEPLLSVITNISYDHQMFLGDTLEKIAFEKAGIFKKNTPVVIGEYQTETYPVFKQKADEVDSPLFLSTGVFKKIGFQNEKMIVENEQKEHFVVGLTGDYQLKNVSTVISATQVYNDIIKKSNFSGITNLNVLNQRDIRFGLENVVELTGLQGRWQILQTNPTVVVDTGHNVAGIKYVTEQLKVQKFNKLHIVFGMVNDKDTKSVLKILPCHAVYYFTQAQITRALPANELLQQANDLGLQGRSFRTVNEAVESALKNAEINDFVFIGGSNFVVGEALECF